METLGATLLLVVLLGGGLGVLVGVIRRTTREQATDDRAMAQLLKARDAQQGTRRDL